MNEDKYFDKLINSIKNPLEFNILISLDESVKKLSNNEKFELDEKLKIIGVSNGYFNIIREDTGWYSLTTLGLELKESKKPYKKFKKNTKTKSMTRFEKWSLILVVVGIILASFWECYDIYKSETVNNQFYRTNDSLKSKTYNKVEEKERTVLDTSKTKKASD